MKRLVKVILLFTMIMSLSGCGEKQKEDWLSGKGLSITKKSDFKEFESTTYDQSDKENYHTNGEVKIPTKIEIDETKEECEEGRKKVRLTAELDLSVNEDDGLYWYITAIDRYTGTEFYSPVTDKRDFILSQERHSHRRLPSLTPTALTRTPSLKVSMPLKDSSSALTSR